MLWYLCIVYNLLSNAVWNRSTEKFERYAVVNLE